MADRDLLERLDGHMARSNEHMARGNELMAEIKVYMARGNELMTQVVREHEETRRFMRDILRRNEIVMGEFSSEMREMRAETAAGRQVLLDLHEDSVAQREAIWTLIDELREHGLGGRN